MDMGDMEVAQIRGVFFIRKSLQVFQKSLHQDHGLRFQHSPIFYFTSTLLFCGKMKSCCDCCFLQQIRPQATAQLYML